ncbi:MAG: glycosyltransferase family 4 protein, partial [Pirellulales bacterium]|nr:glycosyltransferase family 4 protein [Pirellulales bacterium]
AARTLTERLGVPIVSSLSGEDGFIERLPEPYRTEARHELRTRCADLAALVAPSEYYAGFMAEYLAVPRERITVIRPGLDLDGHAAPGSPAQSELLPEESEEIEPSSDELPDERLSEDEVDTIVAEQEPLPPEQKPITIGYLSRVCPTKGLHQLVEAFRLLLREPAMPPMRLRAAGHLGRDDRVYFRQIRRQLSRFGLTDRFEYVGELRRAEKIAFLQSLDILSVPATRPESKGLAVLEALANGTPAVLPDHGVFSELIAETSGGLVHEPNRPSALAVALERMIRNPALVERCGREGQEAIRRDYDVRRTAERMVEFYGTVCKK